jgi:hypothetical protein
MGCEELIQYFLQLQAIIRLYHWQTRSHPRHVASGELYEKLDELIDQFIETFMGRYKRPRYMNKGFELKVGENSDSKIVRTLEVYAAYLRTEVPKYLRESDTDLFNLRDEMLGHINQTLYLFTLGVGGSASA